MARMPKTYGYYQRMDGIRNKEVLSCVSIITFPQ